MRFFPIIALAFKATLRNTPFIGSLPPLRALDTVFVTAENPIKHQEGKDRV